MTYNKNTKVSPDTIKSNHHDWANGVATKGDKTLYHPYTRRDFKFGMRL